MSPCSFFSPLDTHSKTWKFRAGKAYRLCSQHYWHGVGEAVGGQWTEFTADHGGVEDNFCADVVDNVGHESLHGRVGSELYRDLCHLAHTVIACVHQYVMWKRDGSQRAAADNVSVSQCLVDDGHISKVLEWRVHRFLKDQKCSAPVGFREVEVLVCHGNKIFAQYVEFIIEWCQWYDGLDSIKKPKHRWAHGQKGKELSNIRMPSLLEYDPSPCQATDVTEHSPKVWGESSCARVTY